MQLSTELRTLNSRHQQRLRTPIGLYKSTFRFMLPSLRPRSQFVLLSTLVPHNASSTDAFHPLSFCSQQHQLRRILIFLLLLTFSHKHSLYIWNHNYNLHSHWISSRRKLSRLPHPTEEGKGPWYKSTLETPQTKSPPALHHYREHLHQYIYWQNQQGSHRNDNPKSNHPESIHLSISKLSLLFVQHLLSPSPSEFRFANFRGFPV